MFEQNLNSLSKGDRELVERTNAEGFVSFQETRKSESLREAQQNWREGKIFSLDHSKKANITKVNKTYNIVGDNRQADNRQANTNSSYTVEQILNSKHVSKDVKEVIFNQVNEIGKSLERQEKIKNSGINNPDNFSTRQVMSKLAATLPEDLGLGYFLDKNSNPIPYTLDMFMPQEPVLNLTTRIDIGMEKIVHAGIRYSGSDSKIESMVSTNPLRPGSRSANITDSELEEVYLYAASNSAETDVFEAQQASVNILFGDQIAPYTGNNLHSFRVMMTERQMTAQMHAKMLCGTPSTKFSTLAKQKGEAATTVVAGVDLNALITANTNGYVFAHLCNADNIDGLIKFAQGLKAARQASANLYGLSGVFNSMLIGEVEYTIANNLVQYNNGYSGDFALFIQTFGTNATYLDVIEKIAGVKIKPFPTYDADDAKILTRPLASVNPFGSDKYNARLYKDKSEDFTKPAILFVKPWDTVGTFDYDTYAGRKTTSVLHKAFSEVVFGLASPTYVLQGKKS